MCFLSTKIKVFLIIASLKSLRKFLLGKGQQWICRTKYYSKENLSLFELPQQNIPDWVTYKQIPTYRNSGGCNLKIKVLSWSDEGPLQGHRLLISSHGGKDELSFWGLLYKGANPTRETTSPGPNHLPETPHLNTITLGIRSTYGLWRREGTNVQTIAQSHSKI